MANLDKFNQQKQPKGTSKLVTLLLTPILLTATLALSSCATPYGAIFTSYEGPITATSNKTGDRVGKSCAFDILKLVALGDASIEKARQSGRISEITSIDFERTSILGAYTKFCTVVRGR